jgi:hypothetical protein
MLGGSLAVILDKRQNTTGFFSIFGVDKVLTIQQWSAEADYLSEIHRVP